MCFLAEDEPSAHVAQLVEHILGKDEVNGSIPFVGSAALMEAGFGAVMIVC